MAGRGDSQMLEALFISGDKPRALDVVGGIRSGRLEVNGTSLLSDLDVKETVNVGGDANVCGLLRCDQMYHLVAEDPHSLACSSSSSTQPNPRIQVMSQVLRQHLLPDTHPSKPCERMHIGSNQRRWEWVYGKNLDVHHAKHYKLDTAEAKIGTVDSNLIRVKELQVDGPPCISYTTETVTYNSKITLIKPLTFLILDNSSQTNQNQVQSSFIPVYIDPKGGDGCQLEIVSLKGDFALTLPSGELVYLPKKTGLRLFCMQGTWIIYQMANSYMSRLQALDK
jgi:hypothetical protein